MEKHFKGHESDESKSDYEEIQKIDQRVQELDPLLLDSFLIHDLPELNNSGNIESILKIVDSLDLEVKRLEEFSLEEAMAAVRDLNMILSSLRRHNFDLSKVSKIEKALIFLSQKTGEVPTDTVFSYGTRNPQNERMRTFTNLPEEKLFIGSFQIGMVNLPSAIKSLEESQQLSSSDDTFAEKVNAARESFEAMIKAVAEVRRKITPEVFTNKLRPFFEPKTINGKTYQASGGAQMPIILIDQILWGSDINDPAYKKYLSEGIQYQPHFLREKGELFSGNKALVGRIISEVKATDLSDAHKKDVAKKSLTAIYDLLSFVEKFRIPHLKMAEANMQIRPGGSVGSGGYDTSILHFLLDHISEAKRNVFDELNKLK